jgi:ferredoxin
MGQGRGVGRGMAGGPGACSVFGGSPPPATQGAQQEVQALKSQVRELLDQLRILSGRLAEIEGVKKAPRVPKGKASVVPSKGEGKIPGAKAIVDMERCTCCGICVDLCPEHAISMNDIVEIDDGQCNGCGSCIDECPNEALSLSGPA